MGTWNLIWQGLASGVVTGCVYALVALSLVIVYKSTDVVNFAGGELVMIGAYLGLFILLGLEWPYVALFVLVPIGSFVLGGFFTRFSLDKVSGRAMVKHANLVPLVVATIALSYLLKGIVRVIPFTEEVRRLPPLMTGPPIFLGDVVIQQQDIAIVLVTTVVMIILWLFFGYTFVGKALRATSQNNRAAALLGIPVNWMKLSVWGLSSAIAGIAGILLAPKLLMTPDMGTVVMLAFAAAIIGGFSSLPGCVVGGIALGILQNMVGIFISPQAIAVTPFFVIMLVLLFKPQGFFDTTLAVKKV
jgi:branched-chain amino acid transport system permease protein